MLGGQPLGRGSDGPIHPVRAMPRTFWRDSISLPP